MSGLLALYWPLLLVAFYLPSLTFGYLWDDRVEVIAGWERSMEMLPIHARVFYYVSFALTNPLFDQPWQHRLVNIALYAGTLVAAIHAARAYRLPYAPLLVAAIYSHPTFVYAITFISQRNDLFLQLFLMLTLIYATRKRGIVMLICSNFAKTPWIFQNVWYIWKNWRSGVPRWYLLIAVLLIVAVFVQGLAFWGGVKSGASSPMVSFEGGGLAGTAFVIAVRGAKVLEGLFMIHLPFQAIYKAVPAPAFWAMVLVYAAAWVALLVRIVRKRGDVRTGLEFLGLALLMSLPFAANSDPRVLAPPIPFVIFAWAAFAGSGRIVPVALTAFVCLNIVGTLSNYHLSDTGAYTPAEAESYELCGAHEMTLPMDRWRCERADVAREIVNSANRLLR